MKYWRNWNEKLST